MNWYFIIICIIYILNVGVSMARVEDQNGCGRFISTIIGTAIGLFLNYMAVKTGF